MALTINCKGKLIDLSSPKVMGILNITPDSFFDGGKYLNDDTLLRQVEKMLNEGATFIDVGAYSSRPGALDVSEGDELKKVLHTIEVLTKEFKDILISVDTFRSSVAEQAINVGACMINDISASSLDAKMFETVAKLQVPYILMHMQGTPQNMQNNPTYKDIVQDIIFFFSEKIAELRALKVSDILIDVGFGFGKTIAHNYELLKNLELLKTLEAPILTGLSRKSMLYKLLETSPQQALNATTSANTIALLNGSNILRVHDVKEAMEAIKIVGAVKS